MTIMRVFLTALAGLAAVVMTPAGVHAKARPALPLVAILTPGSVSTPPGGVEVFQKALAELGWVEGRTVRFETRYGDWQPDRMAAMARELVALRPDVLYTHSDSAVRAAIRTTTSIPIVDLIVNMRTARALRITIPGTILVRADRAIE